MNREQLEAFRRQVEEDYRLDIAAIERLQRRFSGPTTNVPAVVSVPGNLAHIPEPDGTGIPALESQPQELRIQPQESRMQPQPQPDELTGTLRTMFSNYRK